MGVLSVTHTRGHAVFTFLYDKPWIKADKARNLDPDFSEYKIKRSEQELMAHAFEHALHKS